MPSRAEQTSSPERNEIYASYFAARYAQVLSTPLELQNHVCRLRFESHRRLVGSRQEELKNYLLSTSARRAWGRTLASEVAISMLLRSVLAGAFRNEGGRLLLVPTDLDRSDYKGAGYHKGFDLILVAGEDRPLLGIDVTIGQGKFLRKKLERPGIHLGLGIPVTVLPLRGIPLGNGRENIHEHLDESFRKQIIESGRYSSFADWGSQARSRTEMALLERLIDQIEVTKSGLWGFEDSRIANYPHLSSVFAQAMRLQNSLGRHILELSGRRSFLIA